MFSKVHPVAERSRVLGLDAGVAQQRLENHLETRENQKWYTWRGAGLTLPIEQRGYLSVGQLDGSRTLVPLLHVHDVVLAGAVLGVGPVQRVLVAGRDRVEVRGGGDGGQVARPA